MTATTTSGTVEHDDYPGRLLMEARAEIERLRHDIERHIVIASEYMTELRAPPTEAEVEAAADAMVICMFAPHELPIEGELWDKYLSTARAALEAAAKVREK